MPDAYVIPVARYTLRCVCCIGEDNPKGIIEEYDEERDALEEKRRHNERFHRA